MLKGLLSGIVCVTMLLGGNMQKQSVQEYLSSPSRAVVIVDGDYNNIEKLDELKDVVSSMLEDSHTMPAFGVSIHTETLKAIQKGVWLKLQYNGTQVVDEMMFDELLIEVNPEFSGFNIIRGNRGIYEGRCYYIDLTNSSMKELYDFILSKTT